MYDEVPATLGSGCADADCRSGKRNRFFRGKWMKAEEFDIEQRYFIGRRHLINRAVLGWGVVYGFKITGPRPAKCDNNVNQEEDAKRGQRFPAQTSTGTAAEPKAFTVGPGFALDRHGREIVLVEPASLGPANVFQLVSGRSGCQVRPADKLAPGRYVLSIHYAERRIGDANLPEGCGCVRPEKKFTCETAVFSLTAICGDDCPCAEADCERHCECGATDSCCNRGRGPHACLCQWVTEAKVAADPEPLWEWKGYWLSPSDGVGLACLTIIASDDKCKPVVIGSIDDDCGPRRLVKGNDLLYDLVRGCDLTRISWISWHEWHRSPTPVPWQKFADKFRADQAQDGMTDFVIQFSGPVLVDSIRFDTVVVTVVTLEQATGWYVTRRVPITQLDTTTGTAGLPTGTTDQIRLFVRPRWIRDEIAKDEASWLSEREFSVEIEIRGDLILDCHRQPVDGEAIGVDPAPSGNGTPGGTYISSFRVCPKPIEDSTYAA